MIYWLCNGMRMSQRKNKHNTHSLNKNNIVFVCIRMVYYSGPTTSKTTNQINIKTKLDG